MQATENQKHGCQGLGLRKLMGITSDADTQPSTSHPTSCSESLTSALPSAIAHVADVRYALE